MIEPRNYVILQLVQPFTITEYNIMNNQYVFTPQDRVFVLYLTATHFDQNQGNNVK